MESEKGGICWGDGEEGRGRKVRGRKVDESSRHHWQTKVNNTATSCEFL
jgi:hypothetical protein